MASTTTVPHDEKSSVLLLGASGRLGQMLRHCWSSPPDLVCHSRQLNPEFITFDLMLEPKRAIAAMAGKSAVVCLSGITHARVASHGDVYSRNTDLALAALRAAHSAGVPRVFFASTAAVYGAGTGMQKESATPHPANGYGQAKLEMEEAAIRLAEELGQNVTSLRIGNVAGADAILGGWHKDMQIDQFPNKCTPARSYVGPHTLTRTIAQLCETPDLPTVLNLATPGTVEMGALLDEAGLTWTSRPALDGAIARVELSTKLLERYVTFGPDDCTPAGIVRDWATYKANSGTSL